MRNQFYEKTAYVCISCCISVVFLQIIVLIISLFKYCSSCKIKKKERDVSKSKTLPFKSVFELESSKEQNLNHSKDFCSRSIKEESKMQIYKLRSEQFDPIHYPDTFSTPEKETTFEGRNESQHIIVKKISIRKLVKMKPIDLEEDS